MNKTIVLNFLDQSVDQATLLEDTTREKVHLAIEHCHTWLTTLPWRAMLPPVVKECLAIKAEAKVLVKLEKQPALAEQVAKRLYELEKTYDVYYQFYQWIAPTAKRAAKLAREVSKRP